MIVPRRGDVVLTLFPYSDLSTIRRRPALVVQADSLVSGINQTIVAMITSNLMREGHPSRIRLNVNSAGGRQAGIKTDSILMTDNLATVFNTEIDKVIGAWPDMGTVDAALRHTLALA